VICTFSILIRTQVPAFRTKACSMLMPPSCRMPSRRIQDSASAFVPTQWWKIGFDITLRYRHLNSGSLSFIFIELTCPFHMDFSFIAHYYSF